MGSIRQAAGRKEQAQERLALLRWEPEPHPADGKVVDVAAIQRAEVV